MSSITNTQAFVICTKCEGKFVSVSPTRKMLLSMCSVLAWAGGRAGILTDNRFTGANIAAIFVLMRTKNHK